MTQVVFHVPRLLISYHTSLYLLISCNFCSYACHDDPGDASLNMAIYHHFCSEHVQCAYHREAQCLLLLISYHTSSYLSYLLISPLISSYLLIPLKYLFNFQSMCIPSGSPMSAAPDIMTSSTSSLQGLRKSSGLRSKPTSILTIVQNKAPAPHHNWSAFNAIKALTLHWSWVLEAPHFVFSLWNAQTYTTYGKGCKERDKTGRRMIFLNLYLTTISTDLTTKHKSHAFLEPPNNL